MIANPYIIGLLAGLLSGGLSSFAIYGASVAKFLVYLAPLPCFIAGFGWRLNASLAATLAGTFFLAALSGPSAGFGFLLSIGIPTLILTHLAYLSRDSAILSSDEAGNHEINDQTGGTELQWFPVGNLLFWAAVMAGLLAIAVIFSLGADIESYRATVKELFEKTFLKQLESLSGKEITPSDASSISEIAISILPGASALSWLTLTVFNMWLGARLTMAMGRFDRPWPKLAAFKYPNMISFCFVGAIILTMVPGIPQLIGIAFTTAFVFLYILLGFAVLHSITEGNPFRPYMLILAYVVFIFTGQWGIMIMVTLGLAEPLLKIRARMKNPPPSGSGSP